MVGDGGDDEDNDDDDDDDEDDDESQDAMIIQYQSTAMAESEQLRSPQHPPVAAQMIVPRLNGLRYETNRTPKRTAHACERCRLLKAKCSGGLRCEKCTADKAECIYGDGKRERNKK